MKLIIAGSRTIDLSFGDFDEYFYRFDISVDPEDTEIVSGTAKGVDIAGERYAKECSLPIHRFPADWDKYGKGAGHIRNKQMADYADALLLIWDGESRGSKNMKETMLKLNKPVYEVIIKKE